MRWLRDGFFFFFVGMLLFSSPGCGSREAEVAPRTEEEIAEYKKEVYAAEEADTADE